MIITGATEVQIKQALADANRDFDGNLRFKRFDKVKVRRDGRPVYSVTLTVVDSRRKGSRRSSNGRRIAAACWHAYGTFIDCLPAGTEVETSAGGLRKVRPGDRWHDWNAGSIMYPVFISKLCEC